MEKKKVILTLCKSFPVTHSKAGEATDFEKKLKDKSKIHTIRYNAKNVWDGRYKDIVSGKKYLSIREWTGRPYNSEQKEIAQLPKIGLQHVTMTYSSEDAYPEIWIDNKQDKFFLAGYNNASFDNQFLRAWFLQNGDKYFGSYFWSNSIDVMVLATPYLASQRSQMENFKQGTVAKALGIEIDESRLHDALYDIQVCKSIYDIVSPYKM